MFIVYLIMNAIVVGLFVFTLWKTRHKRRKRLLAAGGFLLYGIVMYPFLVQLFGHYGGFDGVVYLLLTHMLILACGVIFIIVALFTKPQSAR